MLSVKQERNYGIDLFKIVLMFMICMLHTLKRSGLLGLDTGTLSYQVAWLLEVVCFCGVDGYALISGYNANPNKKWGGYARIIEMWFQVFFYSCILSFILALIGIDGDMTMKTIIKSFFPVTFKVYWYFSQYVILVVLKPFINKFIVVLEVNEARLFLMVSFLLFCVIGIKDPFGIQYGYSAMWICYLYIVGCLVKKLSLLSSIHGVVLGLCSLGLCLLTWIVLVVAGSDILISYASPTIVIIAICLLELFSRLNFKSKIVKYLAGLTFGIYLFQSNRIIYENTLNRIDFAKNGSVWLLICGAVGFSLFLFVVGAIVECLRLQTFKLMKIDSLSKSIDMILGTVLEKIISK